MCLFDAGLINYIIHKFDITAVSPNLFVIIFYNGDCDCELFCQRISLSIASTFVPD
jgi:hypothetical protein